jgi:UDP-N-acetylglucosamine--N-acetylmuramyl-(pentapeptide) pyrophosphoryl-undecaprenol N-acetylglucosamine transferase
MLEKYIFFTGGGTGGHVFPGLAVIETLKQRCKIPVLWLCSRAGMERSILSRENIPYICIAAGKLRRYFSIRNFFDLFKIAAGLVQSIFIMLKYKPLLLFAKGGYVSVPPVIAAFLLNIPVFTHESDLLPGLATKINSLFARKIFISFDQSERYFGIKHRAKLVHTGNPVRRAVMQGHAKKGRQLVGCTNKNKLILVLGGSQGSEQINGLINTIIDSLTHKYFVVHQMGKNKTSSAKKHKNYYVTEFLKQEYAHVLRAADLVICRAGANTLWELAVTNTPAILIPLSLKSSRGDQIINAGVFAANGACLILSKYDNTAQKLLEIITNLLDNEEKLKVLQRNAKKMGAINSARLITSIILKQVKEK